MFWALRNSGEDSNQAFSEGNHHISPKRNLRIGLTPAGGSGKGFLWQEGTVALGGSQRTWVRWWIARLRAPPGPPHCPARLGARPQPDPHVGSRTSAPLPPPARTSTPPFYLRPLPCELGVPEPLPPRLHPAPRATDARLPCNPVR